MTREENRELVEALRPLLETISKSAIVLEVGIISMLPKKVLHGLTLEIIA